MSSRAFLLASLTLLCATATCVSQENIGGIGVAPRMKDGQIFIMKVVEGGPAAISGEIHENDRVLAVAEGDGAAVTVGPNIRDAIRLIKGPVGSTVRLTIVPAGKPDSDARIVSLVRAQIKGMWGDGKDIPPGADAPDLELSTLPGDQAQRLSSHRGKVVVLVFWASWCGPCDAQMTELQAIAEKHPEWKDKVVLLAVSVDDDKAKAVEHVKEKEWKHTLNVWGGGTAMRIYRADSIPTSYVINAEGKVATSNRYHIEAVVTLLVK